MMCGIVGVLKKNGCLDKKILLSMTNSMQHRGPDSGSLWLEHGIGLGHRRLSIIDLSSTANQPFIDNTGNFIVVFNGELYNFKSIKKELTPKYSFKTNSDTEVILYAFIEWGEMCLQKFNGMFALAIWNKRAKKLFIARDRLGIKPFYYYQDKANFLFASELRTLLESGLVKKYLSEQGVIEYLSYQTVNSPNTIIKDIYQLKPGEFGVFHNNKLELSYYWQIDKNYRKYNGENLIKIKKNIKELFFEAVKLRMLSDVPLGAFLSGGIDSSAIVAAMAEISMTPPSTFSIGFYEKEFDESQYASLIAKKFATNHFNIKLSATDFLEQLPIIIPTFDTPSGDGVNTYIVSELVKRQGITVALSGLGGDELFAGYQSFTRYYQLSKFSALWHLPKSLKLFGLRFLKHQFNSYHYNRFKQILSEEKFSLANIFPYLRRFMSNDIIVSLLTRKPQIKDGYQKVLLSQELGSLGKLGQVSIGEITGYTQNVLLKDTDQMSMAHALEVRVPFFDHNLVEYVLGIPDKYKYPKYAKQLLVDSLFPLLPDEIVHRRKMGFSFPWEKWLRNELKEFCAINLKYLGQHSIFNAERLNALWDDFLNEKPYIKWSHIWVLVILGSWTKNNTIIS